MTTRIFNAVLAGITSVLFVYMAGAGSNYPLVWLAAAAVLAFVSAINSGWLDSWLNLIFKLARGLCYLGIFICLWALFANRDGEIMSLMFAGLVVALLLSCTLSERPSKMGKSAGETK